MIELHVEEEQAVSLTLEESFVASSVPYYDGEYSVTPSESEQTLLTSGKQLQQDVVVGAIPYQNAQGVSF